MRAEEFIQSMKDLPLAEVNGRLAAICGVDDFFADHSEMENSRNECRGNQYEYGDWQTNMELARGIVRLVGADYSPQVIVEPTCGEGHFVLASLEMFDSLTDVYAVEIYRPYIQRLKMALLQGYLDGKYRRGVKFHILHGNVFDVDWSGMASGMKGKKVLVVGNPPWVTNSALSKIDSVNLPKKSNFKGLKGLSAMTGKGNFDIAEYICYQMVAAFTLVDARFALLLKNSVIRQLCQSIPRMQLPIAELKQYKIDAKKEFGAAVDASLVTFRDGKGTACCEVYDYYTRRFCYEYGWVNGKFVSNVLTYKKTEYLDGVSPIMWRSGIKHDCQQVLELAKVDGRYRNKLGETVEVENECIYPYVKSSDLQVGEDERVDRYIIVTQNSVGEDTEVLQYTMPRLYEYLVAHRAFFDRRKSSIYKRRSAFSIFGVGEYTFKPYKIVISSLYSSGRFVLLPPVGGKCVIPDDTCYMIGFDRLEEAETTLQTLSAPVVSEFMHSIAFNDAKRVVTKDVLMRINLQRVDRLKKLFVYQGQPTLEFGEG